MLISSKLPEVSEVKSFASSRSKKLGPKTPPQRVERLKKLFILRMNNVFRQIFVNMNMENGGEYLDQFPDK